MVRVGSLIHQVKGHLRRGAEQLLDAVGVVDAGELHDDAAVALAGDLRVEHARSVDAATDDLDGLLHGSRRARGHGDRVGGEHQGGTVRLGGDIEFGGAAG